MIGDSFNLTDGVFMNKTTFPNYVQMHQRVPQFIWNISRFLTVGIGYGLIMMSFTRPQAALFIFWRLIVPVLPILFFIAPGIWRNICPMAALNQTPRTFNFGRSLTLPNGLKNYAPLIGIVLFVIIVPTRKELFNSSGPALGLLLLLAFTAALVGGYFFKGKSGWCSTLCPLLSVERLYGQTPFVTVPNNYCPSCVGCIKNCYDFNPALANIADHYDTDHRNSLYRRLFAGAFPGLILGFYILPDAPQISAINLYSWIAFFMLMSLGLFLMLELLLKASAYRLTTLFGAVALNYFYLFNIPIAADTLHQMFGITLPAVVLWSTSIVIFILSAVWIYRTYRKERHYMPAAKLSTSEMRRVRSDKSASQINPRIDTHPIFR
jgi:nitrite reductase (NADH) large subunit